MAAQVNAKKPGVITTELGTKVPLKKIRTVIVAQQETKPLIRLDRLTKNVAYTLALFLDNIQADDSLTVAELRQFMEAVRLAPVTEDQETSETAAQKIDRLMSSNIRLQDLLAAQRHRDGRWPITTSATDLCSLGLNGWLIRDLVTRLGSFMKDGSAIQRLSVPDPSGWEEWIGPVGTQFITLGHFSPGVGISHFADGSIVIVSNGARQSSHTWIRRIRSADGRWWLENKDGTKSNISNPEVFSLVLAVEGPAAAQGKAGWAS